MHKHAFALRIAQFVIFILRPILFVSQVKRTDATLRRRRPNRRLQRSQTVSTGSSISRCRRHRRSVNQMPTDDAVITQTPARRRVPNSPTGTASIVAAAHLTAEAAALVPTPPPDRPRTRPATFRQNEVGIGRPMNRRMLDVGRSNACGS